MSSPTDDVSPAWTRDLGARALRVWTLFGGRSRDDRERSRDDDDDDDLPRPNAVIVPLLFGRSFGPALVS